MIERHQRCCRCQHQGSIEEEDKSRIRDAIAKASEYNNMLFQTQGASIGDLQNEILSEENYENLLNLSGTTGVMGSIEIPKINVDIPIYHGTSEEVLASGVGHFQDSSLPVGGNNTRCILTGHRGLPNSKLFTRLDELEKEDLFFISTCGETLAYRITEIEVMEPEEAELLEILPEKDLCTLITCTPYGINTQRLVVTGERVPYEKVEYDSIEKIAFFRKLSLWYYLLFCSGWIDGFLGGKDMEKRMSNKFSLVITVLLIFVFCIQVYAETDTQQHGSISIALTEGKKGTSRENVEFSCTKIGEMKNGEYILKDEFLSSKVELNALKTADDMEKAANKLAEMDIQGEKVLLTDKNGKLCFSGLTKGVYFLEATDIAGYEAVAPFLISIPTFDEKEGRMNYDITVMPKHEPEKITTDAPQKPGAPQTGLDSPILKYFAGAFFIALFLVVWNIKMKNTKKK